MNHEIFNVSIRKFLKMVGVNSQREMEQAVRRAIEAGMLAGDEALPVKCTLQILRLGVEVPFSGEIRLK
jgi:hypothetical protein